VITLAGTLGTRLNHVTFGFLGEGRDLDPRLRPARLVLLGSRDASVALSIREKEFVEAARMVGASNRRIIRSHVFHLVRAADRPGDAQRRGVHPREAGLVSRARHPAADGD
jgi:hypothetical protein